MPSRIKLLTTGGTIAFGLGGAFLGGDGLLRRIDPSSAVQQIDVEEIARIGSSELTIEHWAALASAIERAFIDGYSGVVITHGTDTLEETAFLLDLILDDPRPVVITGAMLHADAEHTDGPENLEQALAVADSAGARGRGVLVVLNGEIHSARTVRKMHVSAAGAFQSPGVGPEGSAKNGAIIFLREAQRPPARVTVSPDQIRALPRVDIVWSYFDGDGELLRAAMRAGAKGAVIASFGSGRLAAGLRAAVFQAAESDFPIVLASRVEVGELFANAAWPDALISAGVLDPLKARIIVMLGIASGQTHGDIQRLIDCFR